VSWWPAQTELPSLPVDPLNPSSSCYASYADIANLNHVNATASAQSCCSGASCRRCKYAPGVIRYRNPGKIQFSSYGAIKKTRGLIWRINQWLIRKLGGKNTRAVNTARLKLNQHLRHCNSQCTHAKRCWFSLQTFIYIYTTQPPYLYDLIFLQTPRNTRSSSVVTLARPPIAPP